MDKVVLVTGASAGIGMATARSLAASGWTVLGASRRGTAGEGWSGLVMDVDDDDSVRDGVASVLDRHGRLDAVVAGAGWGLAGAVEQTPIADARAQFETNFWGGVRVVQAALPAMRSNGSGRIVLISSIGGVVGLPFQAFYSASKFALEGFGEAMAYEVEPLGIKVTLVEPGNVRTEFTAKRRLVPDSGVRGGTGGVGAGVATGGVDAREGTGEGAGGADAGMPSSGATSPVATQETDAAYAKSRALGTMEADERNGVPAENVATAVLKVLSAKRPPRRVSVGKPSERIGVIGKRILPFRLFEASAKGSLGV